MSNYIWAVSAGGTITAGGNCHKQFRYRDMEYCGAQTVSVNYTNSNGCTAAAPVVLNVTVNPLPVQLSQPHTGLCKFHGMFTPPRLVYNYIWAVSRWNYHRRGNSPQAIPLLFTWNTTGAKTVSVNYTNFQRMLPPLHR